MLLKKSDFTFEDKNIKVLNIVNEKTGVILLLDVPGVTDTNQIPARLDGQRYHIKGEEFGLSIGSSSFYPTYKKIDLKGDKFEMELGLVASCGKFNININKDSVVLGKDFKNGTVEEVKLLEPNSVLLKILVPTNGNTIEKHDFDGDITLKAGAMTNLWGEKADSVSFERNYSKQSLGRSLNDTDVTIIKNIVGGFGNTKVGTAVAVCSGIGSAVSLTKLILEATGVIESDAAKTQRLINEAKDEIINEMNSQFNEVKDLINLESLSRFNHDLWELNRLCDKMTTYYEQAAKDLNIEYPAYEGFHSDEDSYYPDGVEDPFYSEIDVPYDDYDYYGTDAYEEYGYGDYGGEDQPVEDIDIEKQREEYRKKYQQEWDDIDKKIKQYISSHKGDGKYTQFESDFNKLDTCYNNIIYAFSQMNLRKPLEVYDDVLRRSYNFDTTADKARGLYYSYINDALVTGFLHIASFYDIWNGKTISNSYISDFTKLRGELQEKCAKLTKAKDYIYCYTNNKAFNKELEFIKKRTKFAATTNSGMCRVDKDGNYKAAGNFSKEQIKEFIRKCHGEPIESQLFYAGFKFDMKDTVGLALSTRDSEGKLEPKRIQTTFIPWGTSHTDERLTYLRIIFFHYLGFKKSTLEKAQNNVSQVVKFSLYEK